MDRIHEAPQKSKKKKQKKKRKLFSWKWLVGVIVFLGLIYMTLFLLVVPERPDHSFFEGGGPMVIAHRGGGALGPENTLVAIERSNSIGADIIEFDIQMSQDGQLVVLHDPTVDRTTNGEGRVDEMTLAEIQELDAAYHFQDVRGRYIYRGQQVMIPTVEEVFEEFNDLRFMVDIKVDTEDEQQMEQMASQLWQLIEAYDMEDQVLVFSFSEEMRAHFSTYAQDRVPVGASRSEAQRFVTMYKLYLHRLYRPQSDLFIMPVQLGMFRLDENRLIEWAHRMNMPVLYWTYDEDKAVDEYRMKSLLEKGADGIITPRPDLLIRVINEMEETDGTS